MQQQNRQQQTGSNKPTARMQQRQRSSRQAAARTQQHACSSKQAATCKQQQTRSSKQAAACMQQQTVSSNQAAALPLFVGWELKNLPPLSQFKGNKICDYLGVSIYINNGSFCFKKSSKEEGDTRRNRNRVFVFSALPNLNKCLLCVKGLRQKIIPLCCSKQSSKRGSEQQSQQQQQQQQLLLQQQQQQQFDVVVSLALFSSSTRGLSEENQTNPEEHETHADTQTDQRPTAVAAAAAAAVVSSCMLFDGVRELVFPREKTPAFAASFIGFLWFYPSAPLSSLTLVAAVAAVSVGAAAAGLAGALAARPAAASGWSWCLRSGGAGGAAAVAAVVAAAAAVEAYGRRGPHTQDEAAVEKLKEALKWRPFKGVYARPVPNTGDKDSSSIYRCVKDASDPQETTLQAEGIPFFPEIKSPYELLKAAARMYGPNVYLGERTPIRDAAGKQIGLRGFRYFTYADTLRVVEALGRALDQEVEVPLSRFSVEGAKPLRIIGVWSRSRMDWKLVEFAASYRGIVTVPLYDTLGEESVRFIVQRTQMQVVAVEGSKVADALKLKESGIPIKAIISFDPLTKEQQDACKAADVALYHLEMLRKRYLTLPDNKKPEELAQTFEDVATIIFTSGTTGLPKGAVHTNGSLLSFVGSYVESNNRLRVHVGDSTLTYLPLAHIYQRGVDLIVTLLGVRLGFFSGDMLAIVEDLQLFKPTIFIGVPRVFSKILANIKLGISRKHPIVRWLADKAMQVKKNKHKKNPTQLSAFLPDLLFQKVRSTFGGSIRSLSMGSAPMESAQLQDLELYLSASICEGWGMTEAGIAFVQDAEDGVKGTIGGPLKAIEYKVVSLPALRYDATDETPRGELLIRGPCVMREYFLDKEKTEEVLDADGWLKTGDVVEIHPNGAVRIIDRAKNIFKLAHGEYVAPERLENIYLNSEWVEQIFVYGDSLEAVLVAVVVPSLPAIKKWAEKNGKGGMSNESLLDDAELKQQILRDLETLGRKQLHGFEIIKQLHLTATPFSAETGLATPTMKVIRSAARDRFKEEIRQIRRCATLLAAAAAVALCCSSNSSSYLQTAWIFFCPLRTCSKRQGDGHLGLGFESLNMLGRGS
ncbi:hypothetical protein Efla_002250 [Eimeria flavescens]